MVRVFRGGKQNPHDPAAIARRRICFLPETLVSTPQGDRAIGDLESGDLVYQRDGSHSAIQSIDIEEVDGQRVCNLTIHELHNYAVGKLATLVHNGCKKADVDAPKEGIPTIGGRKPRNSGYAGDVHPSGVRFNERGFPDFSPHAKAKVELDGLTGRYSVDEALANKAVGLKKTPDNYVWHHVEDGRTMQLVPKDIHKAAQHTGGSAVIRHWGID